METYQIVLLIIFSSLMLLIVLYFLTCLILNKVLCFPKRFSLEETHKVDVDKGIIPADMSYMKREAIHIKVSDGEIIEGDYINCENHKGIIIIAHGYTWTREGSLKYGQFFYKHGYSLLIYDERGHGANKSKYTTMGFKEGKDIVDMVNYCKERFGDSVCIGLHGESMGAASVMMSLGYGARVDFAIEDCGYASLRELCKDKFRQLHIPNFFLWGCDILLKPRYGFHLDDVKPSYMASKSNVPLLIIHGSNDDFVKTSNAYDIYEENKKHAQIFIQDGAWHATSYQINPAIYESVCMDFINNINKGDK